LVFWVRQGSPHNGGNPPFVEPYFIFLAAVSTANPIIYTIASRRFFAAARYAGKNSCSCYPCNGGRKQVKLLLPGEISVNPKSNCCGFLLCTEKVTVELSDSLTSEDTEDTSLFTNE
jgi:hypothetical protein